MCNNYKKNDNEVNDDDNNWYRRKSNGGRYNSQKWSWIIKSNDKSKKVMNL